MKQVNKDVIKVRVFTVDWIEESKRLYNKLIEYLEGFNCEVEEVDVSLEPSKMQLEDVHMIPTTKIYINGEVVITQEGTTGNVNIDAEHIRRALKESMKKRNIPLRRL